jgi:hypothetical protein
VSFTIHLHHTIHHILSTKTPPRNTTFPKTPSKNTSKNTKTLERHPTFQGQNFSTKNTFYRAAFCVGTGSASSPSTNPVTSCLRAS